MSIKFCLALAVALPTSLLGYLCSADVCNLKVVTDASPDYSDMESLVHSATAKWSTAEEKCWALFYWNHIGRRQTSPMILHGTELTDPIRQFNDYGYTMCSTVSGINCATWHFMGLRSKFWDISLHTVPEVFYADRWHMYDNSMSALYTLCDGRTLAGVEDIGREAGCEASGGKIEPGHVARYHCLNGTGPNGFLTGADTQRSLEEEAHCFNPKALKYRSYYFNWDYGHRYVLNVRPNEVYTRYYSSQGAAPEFFVPNHGRDPDERYHIRGNGIWTFRPALPGSGGLKEAYDSHNLQVGKNGLMLSDPQKPGEVVFKVQGANVITSQRIRAEFAGNAAANISVSCNNGLSWTPVGKPIPPEMTADIRLVDQVNGAYETLIKIGLSATGSNPPSIRNFQVDTVTMLNAKTQPKLNLGKNTIWVAAGEQKDSIVLWPELQNDNYKRDVVDEKNIKSTREHPGYQGPVYPATPGQEAYLVYRMDSPRDISQVRFGGRFYNRAPKSRIELQYSTDRGSNWMSVWSLRRTSAPWDVIHYETVKIPKGLRSVLLKYWMTTSEASPAGCSIYSVRMEADCEPADANLQPLQVAFDWSEQQADRTYRRRGHTQTITHLPFKYTINVGGEDHPVVNSLRVNSEGAMAEATSPEGYSDGSDLPGTTKFVSKWMTCGKNIAIGKSYSLSKPSGDNWGAGDDGKKLTSGAGGPSYAGGTSYRSGAIWLENANPAITVDLGDRTACASFGLNCHGYPWWDALKGEIKDKVEVLTSTDGQNYSSQGFLMTDLRWKDIPVNYMWTDEESMTSATFRLVPKEKVSARFVKFQVFNKRIFDCAGIEVLDEFKTEPFDLRLALPDEAGPIVSLAPVDDGT